jgi:hypothetical protein
MCVMCVPVCNVYLELQSLPKMGQSHSQSTGIATGTWLDCPDCIMGQLGHFVTFQV